MHTGSRADRLAVALDEFVRSSPDVEAAAVVSFDGLPMASALPAELEEDRLGAMSAALLSLGEQAAVGLGRGMLNQIFVEGEHGFVFLMSARDQAVLTAIAGRSAKIGFMLFEMRRAADRIGRALEVSAPGVVAPEAAAPNGSATNGAAADGVATNGAAADGVATNGVAADGALPEGVAPGHPGPSAAAGHLGTPYPVEAVPTPPAAPVPAPSDELEQTAEIAALSDLPSDDLAPFAELADDHGPHEGAVHHLPPRSAASE